MQIYIRAAVNGYVITYSEYEEELTYVAVSIMDVLDHVRELLLFDNQEIDMSALLTDRFPDA